MLYSMPLPKHAYTYMLACPCMPAEGHAYKSLTILFRRDIHMGGRRAAVKSSKPVSDEASWKHAERLLSAMRCVLRASNSEVCL